MTEFAIKDLKQRHIEAFHQAQRDVKAGRASLDADSYGEQLAAFVAELSKAGVKPEQFQAALAEFGRGVMALDARQNELTGRESEGVRVRAACRCGWFEELSEDDVGDLEPWRVSQLDDEIVERYKAAYDVPKN